MNRRGFLKAAAAAFLVPEIIIPERRVFALDQTMFIRPPMRNGHNDTEYLQWHIDNGVIVPVDHYITNETLYILEGSKGLKIDGSSIIGNDVELLIDIKRPLEEGRDYLHNCVIRPAWTNERFEAIRWSH